MEDDWRGFVAEDGRAWWPIDLFEEQKKGNRYWIVAYDTYIWAVVGMLAMSDDGVTETELRTVIPDMHFERVLKDVGAKRSKETRPSTDGHAVPQWVWRVN